MGAETQHIYYNIKKRVSVHKVYIIFLCNMRIYKRENICYNEDEQRETNHTAR